MMLAQLLLVFTVQLASAFDTTATWYGGNLHGGACGFSTYNLPPGIYGTAMTSQSWWGSEICGACVEVTGPNGNSIKTMVVDQCPNCPNFHLDLFSDAFATLADPNKGVINVHWELVACGIHSPIRVRAKEGASRYWFSMQVLNANHRVQTLDVSTDGGGSWKPTERQTYNFFQISTGTGRDVVSVRLECANQKVIIAHNVNVNGGSETNVNDNC